MSDVFQLIHLDKIVFGKQLMRLIALIKRLLFLTQLQFILPVQANKARRAVIDIILTLT